MDRVRVFPVEKFLGSDTEVFTDVKEALHRGQGFFVFDLVDIAIVLSDGERHIASRDIFLYPQLRDTVLCELLMHLLWHMWI